MLWWYCAESSNRKNTNNPPSERRGGGSEKVGFGEDGVAISERTGGREKRRRRRSGPQTLSYGNYRTGPTLSERKIGGKNRKGLFT